MIYPHPSIRKLNENHKEYICLIVYFLFIFFLQHINQPSQILFSHCQESLSFHLYKKERLCTNCIKSLLSIRKALLGYNLKPRLNRVTSRWSQPLDFFGRLQIVKAVLLFAVKKIKTFVCPQ